MKIALLSLLFINTVFHFSSFASASTATISPGDIIAADVFREKLEWAETSSSKATIDELVGSWVANQYFCLGGSASLDGSGLCDGDDETLLLDGVLATDSLFLQRQDSWSIQKESNTRVSIVSESLNFLFNPNFGFLAPNDSIVWSCELAGGEILLCLAPRDNFTYGEEVGCATAVCRLHVMLNVTKYDNDSISLGFGPLDTSNQGSAGNKFGLFNIIELHRKGVISAPGYLNLETELEKVTLSWTFDEPNEIQFDIFRKDQIDGNFVSIGLTNDVVFEDENLGPGHYWYRVYAVSGDVRSSGSNVRKATIGE